MMKRKLFETLFGTQARAMCVAAVLMLAAAAGCEFATAPTAPTAEPVKTEAAAAADSGRVRVSAEGEQAAEPSVATSPEGAVYVAWVGHGAGKEADVWLARFDGGGRRAGAATRVNPSVGAATATRPAARRRK